MPIMKRRTTLLLLFLAGLSALCGYLFSKASFAGRAGITLFYRQYGFLKIWWQGALIVLAVLLLIFFLLWWTHRRARNRTFYIIISLVIFAGLAGLFLTYRDFTDNLSHRLLGSRFHWGGYLFWAGWIAVPAWWVFMHKKMGNENERRDPVV